jgi:hypothetical protein
MTFRPEARSQTETGSALQARFRLRELERRISALRFRLGYVQWLFIPVLIIALIAMIAGLVMGMGSAGPVISGIVAIGTAIMSLFWEGREHPGRYQGPWRGAGFLGRGCPGGF